MKDLLKKKLPKSYKIIKIRGEASLRIFYRIFFNNYTLVAMVYSQDNVQEINRIVKLTSVYQDNGIRVPKILDVFDNQIVLQEDMGDNSLQKVFRKSNWVEKIELLREIASTIKKLGQIVFVDRGQVLNDSRLKWEMDFFIKNFASKFFSRSFSRKKMQRELYGIVDCIKKDNVFAHRDFHSRNLLYHENDICLVDFQDSLFGPVYYDLVSFAYDSYLDLKSLRKYFFQMLETLKFKLDYEQIYLTALQRNVKALGTFGYQVKEKKNLHYKKYINRTIRHILGNKTVASSLPYGATLLKSYLLYMNKSGLY